MGRPKEARTFEDEVARDVSIGIKDFVMGGGGGKIFKEMLPQTRDEGALKGY